MDRKMLGEIAGNVKDFQSWNDGMCSMWWFLQIFDLQPDSWGNDPR